MTPAQRAVIEAWRDREAALRLLADCNDKPLVYGPVALDVAAVLANATADALEAAIAEAARKAGPS